MNIKRIFRIFVGSNALILLTIVLLPALLIDSDISLIQSVIDYINFD